MTRLGGVPIRVAVPPMLAANAMASIIMVLCSLPSSTSTASRMGIIMAVLAVLLIHMERKAVGNMKPSNTDLGELPTYSSTLNPTLLQTDIWFNLTKLNMPFMHNS